MQTCMETTHGKQAINKRTLMQSYTEINKSFLKFFFNWLQKWGQLYCFG